jgi:hypothetical protein
MSRNLSLKPRLNVKPNVKPNINLRVSTTHERNEQAIIDRVESAIEEEY